MNQQPQIQTPETVNTARDLIRKFGSTYEAARAFGVHESTIWNALPREKGEGDK